VDLFTKAKPSFGDAAPLADALFKKLDVTGTSSIDEDKVNKYFKDIEDIGNSAAAVGFFAVTLKLEAKRIIGTWWRASCFVLILCLGVMALSHCLQLRRPRLVAVRVAIPALQADQLRVMQEVRIQPIFSMIVIYVA
jgi:hypothetical protein